MAAIDIADEKYVRLTTFTKDGRRKNVPVWVAPLDDGTACFTTQTDSWKVKRIRHTPRVELAPSNMRGVVADGAPTVTGTATVLEGPDVEKVQAAIKEKYGFQVTMIRFVEKLRGLIGRSDDDTCGIAISLD